MYTPLFTGSATAIITPFTEDANAPDLPFFERLLAWQIREGTDAVVVAGTTGESPVLTADEKRSLFSVAVKTIRKRIPVIAGTGSNNTETAVRNSNAAEKEGVDGLLIVTPFYNKCTQEGLVRHYHYIADRVSTPIIVYNVPSRTGVNILPQTYAAITEHRNITGIKEANGDLSAAASTALLCKNNAALYSGNDDQTVSMMATGGLGVISVAANIFPKAMHELCAKMLQNDCAAASAIQAQYLKYMQALFCEVNPIPVKAALEFIVKRKLPLRLPLTSLPEEKKEKLGKLLQETLTDQILI